MAEPEPSNALPQTLGLLADTDFRRIWAAAESSLLTPNRLAEFPQPAGLAPHQSWELLTAIRSLNAVRLPTPEEAEWEPDGWYYATNWMCRDIRSIASRCGPGSALDIVLRNIDPAEYVASCGLASGMLALRQEGSSAERAREIAIGASRPRNPDENVFAGYHQALLEIDDFASRPFTPDVFIALYERIAAGQPQSSRPRTPAMVTRYPMYWIPAHSALSYASRLVTVTEDEEPSHPVIRAVGVLVIFEACRPFPAWNAVIGDIATKALLLRSGLPALGVCRLAALQRSWQVGRIGPPRVTVAEPESVVQAGLSRDYTLWFGGFLRLVVGEPGTVEDLLTVLSVGQREIWRRLKADSRLNHRQRSVLAAALRDSTARISVESHRRSQQVAYATSYGDLMGLVSRGFLTVERPGRQLVFRPVPRLREIL